MTPIPDVKPAPLWKLWEVSVTGYPPFTTVARSRAKAMGEAWHNMVDCGWRNSSFREFLKTTHVRRHWNESPHTYEGVNRSYEVSVQAGQRIALIHEGPSTGRLGTVQYPRVSSSSRVDVLLDDEQDHIVVVHPQSVMVLDEKLECAFARYRLYCPSERNPPGKELPAVRNASVLAQIDGKRLMILLGMGHLNRDGQAAVREGQPVCPTQFQHRAWMQWGDIVLFQTGAGTTILKDKFGQL